MNGIKLETMDASDMIDVFHYMFEDDMFVSTGEEAEHKSKVRTTLYREFYKKEYSYKVQSSSSNSYGGSTYADGTLLPPLDDEFADADIEPFNPNKRSTPKPYVPPTNFNPDSVLPFGKDIDAPLG